MPGSNRSLCLHAAVVAASLAPLGLGCGAATRAAPTLAELPPPAAARPASGSCTLHVGAPEPLRVPPALAQLRSGFANIAPSSVLRFGESNAPYWLAEPPEWRPVAGALSTIGEVWTPTRRVGTAYASPGPGSVLVVADRASPSPWREVVGGRDAFLTVIDAVDKPRGQTVVIGLTSEPEVKSSIRLITVDAAGRAGAPHLLVPSLGMVGSVRTARVADGTVAIAWVTARAKGSALSLARVSTDTGELVGTPFEVDADEALHPYVAEMALAADGPGVALAWAVHGAKKPTHDREVLLELRIFTQGAPGEAPRRASSRDVSTEEDQSSYTPGALLPIMLEAASLDLHALFAWRPSHESTSLDVLVLGAASPLAVPVPPESYLTLRSLGLVAYAPIKNGLHIMKTSCR